MPKLKVEPVVQERSEKLQQVLAGCTFAYTKDPLDRIFIVDKPNGFMQEVYRKVMQGLKEVLILQGKVSQDESVGDVMVVETTVVGVTVQARVHMRDIVIMSQLQDTHAEDEPIL